MVGFLGQRLAEPQKSLIIGPQSTTKRTCPFQQVHNHLHVFDKTEKCFSLERISGGEEGHHWLGFLLKLCQPLASAANHYYPFRRQNILEEAVIAAIMVSRSSTPSEGEIIESDSEKATKSLQSVQSTSVDPQSRKRIAVSRSPSPIRSPIRRRSPTWSRSRSRSPYRESRGSRWPNEDAHHNGSDRNDPRRFKVHYEDRRHQEKPRTRGGLYKDSDRASGSDSTLRYDDNGGRSRNKRQRTMSRSPPRFSDRFLERDRQGHRKGEKLEPSKSRSGSVSIRESMRLSREQSVSDRGNTPVATALSRREAETGKKQTDNSDGARQRDGNATDKYVCGTSAFKHADLSMLRASNVPATNGEATNGQLEVQTMDDAALIEERRKRREAIKAKYKEQATPLLVQALAINSSTAASSGAGTPVKAASDGIGNPTAATYCFPMLIAVYRFSFRLTSANS
jgi:serine/threonine-protein kinase PRP4